MRPLFSLIFTALINIAFAQVCLPDSTIQASGIYPSAGSMDTAYINIPYNETVTIFVPSDTTVVAPVFPFPTANARVDSVKIENWNNNTSLNLPSGLQADCNPTGCVFPGNSLGCIAVSGIVTNVEDTGSYVISASLTYYFTITNTPLAGYNYFVNTTINPFTIEVKQAIEDSTITSINKNINSNTAVYPNPSKDIFHFNIENNNTKQILLKVFNTQGIEVFEKYITYDDKDTAIIWNASEFNSGIYFYILSRDNVIEKGKLLVTK